MAKKGSKFLADFLSALGIILLLLSSFPGLLYIRKGDFITTGIISLLGFLLILWGMDQLWKAKAAKRNSGFNIKELLFLIFTLLVVLSAYIPMFHFTNLEFSLKNRIQYLGSQKILEIRSLPAAFDEQAAEALTRMEIKMKNERKSQTTINARKESIRKVLNTAKADLLADSVDINRYGKSISTWDRLQLIQAFYSLDEIRSKHIQILSEGMLAPQTQDWAGTFSYEPATDEGAVISNPLLLAKNKAYAVNYWIPLGINLVALFLILMPYFIQDRGLVMRDLYYTD